MQASSHDDVDELCKLYDRLNLTGRVIRAGQHALCGGCAYIWEAQLIPLMSRRSITGGEGEKVAVKVIREVGSSASETILRKRLIREIRAWATLHHRNVLPLLGFVYGFNPGSRLASLVSPWMPNGTARKYLEKRSVSERIRVLTGVADGLCYLHRHDVVHGDLKGENIMIDEDYEPKIADFGLSKLLDEVTCTLTATSTGNPFGSVRWTAPELILQPGVTFESDIWAFGMTILELFTNAPPFRHLKGDAQVIIRLNNGELPSRPGSSFGMDDALWDICCDCWNPDPRLRPSGRVIAKQLWDLDLRCKLAARKKRRAPPSPERQLVQQEWEDDKNNNGVKREDDEGRLRKSPKLSSLAELYGDSLPSPGARIPIQRAVMRRSMTPRTPTRTSSSHGRNISISSSSRSRGSSRSDLASDLVPRRLLASGHSMSDGNIFQHLSPSGVLRRAQTEPTALDLFFDDQSSALTMGEEPSSMIPSTPRQNADASHSSFGAPAPAHAWTIHDAYAYAYGHATPANGYALPQSADMYANSMNGLINGMGHMYDSTGLALPEGYSTPPAGYVTPPSAFSTPPNPFSTPPLPPTSYVQPYPQFDAQQQHLLADTNDSLDLMAQTQFLSGFDADAIQASRWLPSDPRYRHAAFMSAFPFPMYMQNGSPLCHQGMRDFGVGSRVLGLEYDQTPPYLLPPPPIPTEGDSFGSGYSASPSFSDTALPSPHGLGELFFENFQYEPHSSTPANTSPLLYGDNLYTSPPTLQHDLQPSHFNAGPSNGSLPWQHSSSDTVDFESLQRGIISPALSDISTPNSTPLHEDLTPSLFDTSLTSGFGGAFAFESEDEGEELDDSLALIGGLGLGVSDDFNNAATAHVRHIDSTEGTSASNAGPSERRRGHGLGQGRSQGSAPSRERGDDDDAEETPHGSPRQLEFIVPLGRNEGLSLGAGTSAAGGDAGQVQMPPTPSLSPFPPSFPR